MFFNFLNVPLWSSFTEAFSKKDLKWIIYTLAFELIILLIFIFLSLVIYKFSSDILNFWIGDKVEYDNSLSFFLTKSFYFKML